MTARSEYVLEPIREGPDFTLYRGRQRGNPTPISDSTRRRTSVAPESPPAQAGILARRRIRSAWAAKPLALTSNEGRITFILTDPGGEPLDRVLERHQEQPLHLTRFLRIAVGLAVALGQVDLHGLIHKDTVPLEIIAGTLAYIAPEQTGRMNPLD
jgi:hypothetical protein